MRADDRHFGAYSGLPTSRALRAHACACWAHVNAWAAGTSSSIDNTTANPNMIFCIPTSPIDLGRISMAQARKIHKKIDAVSEALYLSLKNGLVFP